MAKRIKNPIEVKIVKEENGITTSLHYGLECEYGDLGRKGYIPELTSQEQAIIGQVVEGAISKIEQYEEIV